MDDSTPPDVVTGPVPVADEGKKPAPETPAQPKPPEGEKPKEPEEGRTYSEAYVKQLRAEAAERRQKAAELEAQLQERADADKTEAQKTAEKLARSEKKLAEAEMRLLRIDVATEHGLDADAATLLSGTTREEMELRAETLTKLLQDRPKAKPPPGFDGGARPRAPESKTPEDAHSDLLLHALGRERDPRRAS